MGLWTKHGDTGNSPVWHFLDRQLIGLDPAVAVWFDMSFALATPAVTLAKVARANSFSERVWSNATRPQIRTPLKDRDAEDEDHDRQFIHVPRGGWSPGGLAA
jgi:hypothetical protein